MIRGLARRDRFAILSTHSFIMSPLGNRRPVPDAKSEVYDFDMQIRDNQWLSLFVKYFLRSNMNVKSMFQSIIRQVYCVSFSFARITFPPGFFSCI